MTPKQDTEKRQISAPRGRGPGRPFLPGNSANPGGRPKGLDDVKALARQFTKAAIERLAFWMVSDNAKASVQASSALLDRGWGRPAQAITGEDGKPLLPTIVTQIIER